MKNETEISNLFVYGFSTLKCKYKPFEDEEAKTEFYSINDWSEFPKLLHKLKTKKRFCFSICDDEAVN